MSVTILDETKSELGEGPTYDRELDIAWWFDIEGKVLFEHDFTSAVTSRFDLPHKASMLAVLDKTTQLVAMEGGLYVREVASGTLHLHQPIEADNPVTRSNDGRVHPCGAIWIGTMGHDAESKAGAIYHFHKGELTKLYPEITIPNAICFSPDAKTAYFVDSMVNIIQKVAVNPQSGLPDAEPEPFFAQGSRKGSLDGAVIDAEGNMWVAVWGAACLQKISPNGKLIDTVPLPATQPSCPCFIGRSLDQLLVTTAWQGNPQAKVKGNGGKTFIVEYPLKGKPEPRVVL